MSGQNASLNVTFTSSGAGAVVGDAEAVQAALSGIKGGSVGVSYESKGGSGAVSEARAFDQAMRAGTSSASDLGREVGRAHQSTSGLGKEAQNARNHMRGVSDEMRSIAGHAELIGRTSLSAGASQLRQELTGSNRSMRELESGAGRASVAVRAALPSSGAGGGAIKDAVIDMRKLSDGTYGVAEGMKAIGSASGAKGFSWAGASAKDMGYTGPSPQDRSGRSNDAAEGRRSPVADRLNEMRAAAGATDEVGKSADRAKGKASGLGDMFGKVSNAGWQMSMVAGAMAGVTGEAVSLTKSTVGMGLNFDGMSAGITRAEQSAARSHNLGLNGLDQELRQSARAMTNDLAPAMKDGVGAVKAWEQAKMGAQGSLGPGISQFANEVKKDAGPLQSIMSSLGGAALSLGSDVVAGVSQSAPAWQNLMNTVGKNSPQLTSFAEQFSNVVADVGSFAANTASVATDIGHGVQKVAGAGPNADNVADAGRSKLFGKSISPLSAVPDNGVDSLSLKSINAGGRAPAAPSGFDPSKPFTGNAVMPDGSVQAGTSTPAQERKAAAVSLGSRAGYHRSSDAAKYDGMTGAQIYDQQYTQAAGAAPGQPRYNGLGPRGAGSSVGAMPASIASGLGMAGGSALPGLMSAMQSAVGSGGAQLGQAAQQHITKAVHQAAPTASAGGASLGAAMGGGMAQGYTSTQAVTDTLIIKHSKHIVDIASNALGVHSPSTEFDFLGRMSGVGFTQGFSRSMAGSFGSIGRTVGSMPSQLGRQGFGYDNVYGGSAPSISVRKASTSKASDGDTQAAANPVMSQAMNYTSPLANANIDAHNQRAQEKLAARADRHQAAINGWNVNPFAGAQAAPQQSWWDKLNSRGPQDDLSKMFSKHGESMASGVGVGLKKGTPAAQNQMSQFSKGMQNQHKKDHGISSPSTVFASDGMNMAAGVGVGFTAGASAAASAMTSAGDQMSAAFQGPLDNQGLQIGYSFATNIVDGATRTLKTANFQSSGTQQIANQQAAAAVGRQGLLGAGAGASVYATPSVSFSGAGSQPQIIHLNMPISLDGQVFRTIATQIAVDQNNNLIEQLFDAHKGTNG